MLDKSKAKNEAIKIMAALDESKQIDLISKYLTTLTVQDAYGIAQEIEYLRAARKEYTVGVKVGFTNRNIWKEYNACAPIVGAIYDTTVKMIDKTFALDGLSEPKIEPEIIFKLKKTPRAEMSNEELVDCVSHVSHGFEIVHSIFKNWQFTPADTIAGFGLHGALLCGPFVEILKVEKSIWLKELSSFNIILSCNGKEVDKGHASNVLGAGPLEALRHILLDNKNLGRQVILNPGDLVTTGTLTGAFSIKRDEVWSTVLHGIRLRGIELQFN
ncbi:MAG: 2-keto-4-pentenoate hydratase [Paracoccaceae bacterium]